MKKKKRRKDKPNQENRFYTKIETNSKTSIYNFSSNEVDAHVILELNVDDLFKKISTATKETTITISKETGEVKLNVVMRKKGGTPTSGSINVEVLPRFPSIPEKYFELDRNNSDFYGLASDDFSQACNNIVKQKSGDLYIAFFKNGYVLFFSRMKNGDVDQLSPIATAGTTIYDKEVEELKKLLDSKKGSRSKCIEHVIAEGISKKFSGIGKLANGNVSVYVKRNECQYYITSDEFSVTTYIGM